MSDFDSFELESDDLIADALDLDQDGVDETLTIDANDDGSVDTVFLDENKDGSFDHLALDTDFDGVADLGLEDVDFDGTVDHEASDIDGDGLTELRDLDSGEVIDDPEPQPSPVVETEVVITEDVVTSGPIVLDPVPAPLLEVAPLAEFADPYADSGSYALDEPYVAEPAVGSYENTIDDAYIANPYDANANGIHDGFEGLPVYDGAYTPGSGGLDWDVLNLNAGPYPGDPMYPIAMTTNQELLSNLYDTMGNTSPVL